MVSELSFLFYLNFKDFLLEVNFHKRNFTKRTEKSVPDFSSGYNHLILELAKIQSLNI